LVSNESSEALPPTDPQSRDQDDSGASTPKGEARVTSQLAVDISQSQSASNPLSIHLGKPSEPGIPTSRIQLIFDLLKDTRVRVVVELLATSQGTPKMDVPAKSQVVIESQGNAPEPIITFPMQTSRTTFSQRIKAGIKNYPYSIEVTLFGLALLVYLITHLVGLTRFPIYFFSDEAIQTVAAENLIRDNFVDEEGTFLPTYIKNGPYFNLSVSVYVQVIPFLLFGKSVFLTRATSVFLSLLAAVSVSLMLRNIYKIPYWWAGVSLLSIAPAWFLHSRTAFETVLFVSFYAACLYTYLLYRYRSPHYLYYAITLGALAFYAYSPGQVVVGLTGILLLLSDARYHWQNRKTVLKGLGLAVILTLPYLRFRLNHPAAPFDQLRILNSYWVQAIPLKDKLAQFWSEYLYGLSPGYWFLPNERDLPRHLMKGYGHLLRIFLPFAFLGLILTLRHVRSAAHRALLITTLVAPIGAALVQIGITRVLVFVFPATILIALGINQSLIWLENWRFPHQALSIGLFTGLSIINIFMLRDVLVNAPTWYQDYGLGGLQYGAQQVFPKVASYLEEEPETKIILSPTWANGTDVVARFFLNDPLPIQMGSINGHLYQRKPLDEDTLFVMTPDEYQQTIESGKFEDIRVEETITYPNGIPGFYFVRLRYVDDIDLILEKERQQRRVLRSAQVVIDGEQVQVKHSMLDMGEVQHMFDGDQYTLGRTFEANPAVIELTYPTPHSIRGVSVIIGSTEVEIKALLIPTSDGKPVEYLMKFQGTVEQPEAVFDFGESTLVQNLHLEIRDLRQSEPANVHIWEITTLD
jgi:4-amino-4-deoxy-L-arabinose transferase-like glycosyltransferase